MSCWWRSDMVWMLWTFSLLIFTKRVCTDMAPAIVWDPTNPLFDCAARNGPEIVLKNGDLLSLSCPNRGSNAGRLSDMPRESMMYESAFLIPDTKDAQKKYQACDATDAVQILRCDTPSNLKSMLLTMRQFSSSASSPVFKPDRTYYIIGTSNGTMSAIDNKKGGHCASPSNGEKFPLKMKIRLCSDKEVANNSCQRCSSVACYSQGCGSFSRWQETRLVMDLANSSTSTPLKPKCFAMSDRNCTGQFNNCNGPLLKMTNRSCPGIKPVIECNNWTFKGDFVNNGSACLSSKSRRCTVGLFSKTTFVETKFYAITCPKHTTIPNPTPDSGNTGASTGEKKLLPSAVSYALVCAAFVLGVIVGIGVFVAIRHFYGKGLTNKVKENDYSFNNGGFQLESPNENGPPSIGESSPAVNEVQGGEKVLN